LKPIKLKEWESLHFIDPKIFLSKIRNFEHSLAPHREKMKEKVLTLRTHLLSDHNERRQGALFTSGVGKLMEYEFISFAHYEKEDYDIVCRDPKEDLLCYTPVQLKEVTPKSLNPNSTVEKILESCMKKYANLDELIIGVFVNRASDEENRSFKIPKGFKAKGLFLYGCCSPDHTEWFMIGDLMYTDSTLIKFTYPMVEPDGGDQ